MGILATGFRTASSQEQRAERLQGQVRIVAAIIMSIYAITASILVSKQGNVEDWAKTLVASYAVYILVAAALLKIIALFPGHYPVRRIFGMLCDYCAAGFSIIAGCTIMLPAYVFIVWIALGNGMRYGRRYLIVASFFAQVCLGIVFLATPHWRADPTMAATLSITALVVPLFAFSLLREKEKADLATKAAIEAKTRFLAQASHDLRQPIHAMTLFLSGLKQTPMTSEQDLLVTRLDRSLDGMAALFRSLLDVSSIDGGALTPKPTAFPVQNLFDEIERQFGGVSDTPSPLIRFVPTRAWVHTDPVLLTTMIQNIVTNAVRHGAGANILIGCRRKNGRISIMVCDQGPGIEATHIPYLFEEFYQVRKAPQSERTGVGLGLAIVQRLADILDIQPELKSEYGKGTSIALHGIEVCQPVIPDELARHQYGAVRTPLLDMHVVMVEDDREMLEMMSNLFRSWGCTIEAFDTMPLTPTPCDLIVTDFDLGSEMTGLDVIRATREASGHEVPAIIVTGHDEVTIARQLLDKGQLVLQKPVKPAELRSAISTLRLNALR